jgi:hypothetical protein
VQRSLDQAEGRIQEDEFWLHAGTMSAERLAPIGLCQCVQQSPDAFNPMREDCQAIISILIDMAAEYAALTQTQIAGLRGLA